MANTTDLNIKLVADLKALREMRKEMAKFAKETQGQFKKQMVSEGKHNKARKRDLEFQRRVNEKMAKNQIKYYKDLEKVKKRGRDKEWAETRKFWREERTMNKERARFRKAEHRANQRERRASRRGGVGRGIARAGMGLMGGLTGMLVGGAVASYQDYSTYHKALGGVIGAGRGRDIKRGVRAGGARMGFNLAESAGQAREMARATGVAGPREMQFAQRAAMLSSGEAAQMFGQLRQSGLSFAGGQTGGQSSGANAMKKILGAAVYSGLERARFPEFAKGVFDITRAQGSARTGDVSPTDVAKILTTFAKTGLSGMQGARGAAVASKLQGAFMKPGGGEWGKSFMQMAMGFGKPGGGTGFYEAEKMREQGLTSDNAQRLLTEVIGQFGGGQEGALAMRELTGVSLEQAEALLKIGKDGDFSKEKLAEIDAVMTESKSLEQQAVDHMKGIGGHLQRLAGRFNQSVGFGARSAKAIEKVQDWQRKIFEALLDVAEKIGELYKLIRTWIMNNTSTPADVKKAIEEMEGKTALKNKMSNPASRAAAVQAQIDAAKEGHELATGVSKQGRVSAVMQGDWKRAITGDDVNRRRLLNSQSNKLLDSQLQGEQEQRKMKQLADFRREQGIPLDADYSPMEQQFLSTDYDGVQGAKNWNRDRRKAQESAADFHADRLKGRKKAQFSRAQAKRRRRDAVSGVDQGWDSKYYDEFVETGEVPKAAYGGWGGPQQQTIKVISEIKQRQDERSAATTVGKGVTPR